MLDPKTIDEFLETLYKSNSNQVSRDSAACELFAENSPFRMICKCGSTDIEIFGNHGEMGSEETGWMSGSTVVKCKKCGTALTVWE